MPRIDQETIRKAQNILQELKVFNINQVASTLSCSISTARQKLRLWRAYTSYNKNGQYYTLPNIPKFNQNDIWDFKGIYFSKHGNLKKTVVNLVNNSESGLTGNQLGNVIGLTPRSFMHHFKSLPSLRRQKFGGVYVYFSDTDQTYQNQILHRTTSSPIDRHHRLSNHDIIIILTSIIKHHGISLDEILALSEIQEREISKMALQNFMDVNNLLKNSGLIALKLLGQTRDNIISDIASIKLFPKKPTINFSPESETCLYCSRKLKVQKTKN